MKVFSAVDTVEEVDELVKAGADEFYCGVLWEDWDRRYPSVPINRRIARACNFKSFAELEGCVKIAHSYNVPVSLTINEHCYTEEQYPFLSLYIEKAIDAGVDSFLISDLALLLRLKERKVRTPIHISIGGTVYNSETVKFYQNLGASRVTLPRHITIDEVREIMMNTSNIETVVFILNSRCPNDDGFCTFMHFPFRDEFSNNACMLPYSVELLSAEEDQVKRNAACSRQNLWSRYHMDEVPCGACALYDFVQMGVSHAKIVGRGNPTWRKVVDIKFIKLLLTLLEDKSISRERYRQGARALYRYTYRFPCRAIMCYYPQVMLQSEILV